MTIHPDDHDATRDNACDNAGHDAARRAQSFDAAARAAHADALQHVSARVQAQLQQRRRAALTGQVHAPPLWRRIGPALAFGGTAALVLAVGVNVMDKHSATPSDTAPHIAAHDETAPTSATPAPDRPVTSDTPGTSTTMTTHAATGAVAATTPAEANGSTKGSGREGNDETMREVDALLAEASGDDAGPSATNRNPAGRHGTDAPAAMGETPTLGANDDLLLAGLDENPDLYLWLGSNEGQADSVELL